MKKIFGLALLLSSQLTYAVYCNQESTRLGSWNKMTCENIETVGTGYFDWTPVESAKYEIAFEQLTTDCGLGKAFYTLETLNANGEVVKSQVLKNGKKFSVKVDQPYRMKVDLKGCSFMDVSFDIE